MSINDTFESSRKNPIAQRIPCVCLNYDMCCEQHTHKKRFSGIYQEVRQYSFADPISAGDRSWTLVFWIISMTVTLSVLSTNALLLMMAAWEEGTSWWHGCLWDSPSHLSYQTQVDSHLEYRSNLYLAIQIDNGFLYCYSQMTEEAC